MTSQTFGLQALNGPLSARMEERIAHFRGKFQTASQRRAVYRRTRDELIGLSDRELADIGIVRVMIPQVAREAAELAVPRG